MSTPHIRRGRSGLECEEDATGPPPPRSLIPWGRTKPTPAVDMLARRKQCLQRARYGGHGLQSAGPAKGSHRASEPPGVPVTTEATPGPTSTARWPSCLKVQDHPAQHPCLQLWSRAPTLAPAAASPHPPTPTPVPPGLQMLTQPLPVALLRPDTAQPSGCSHGLPASVPAQLHRPHQLRLRLQLPAPVAGPSPASTPATATPQSSTSQDCMHPCVTPSRAPWPTPPPEKLPRVARGPSRP